MIIFFEPEWITCLYRNPCAKVTASTGLIAIAHLTSTVFPLVIAANRDELYASSDAVGACVDRGSQTSSAAATAGGRELAGGTK